MRKTVMAAALALSMALTALSGFAATPKSQATTPNLSPVVQPRLVSEYLADTIFLAAPSVTSASSFALVNYGVCSSTCDECYGPNDCPLLPGGHRQTCTFACY